MRFRYICVMNICAHRRNNGMDGLNKLFVVVPSTKNLLMSCDCLTDLHTDE